MLISFHTLHDVVSLDGVLHKQNMDGHLPSVTYVKLMGPESKEWKPEAPQVPGHGTG